MCSRYCKCLQERLRTRLSLSPRKLDTIVAYWAG